MNRPTLLGIAHDGPVVVRQLGKGHDGIVWTVQPENFATLVAQINEWGGPSFWDITPV